MNENLKIQMILGSTRPNRRGEVVANWAYPYAQQFAGWQAELLDLRDFPLPLYNEPAPISALAGNYTSEVGKQWAAKVKEADAYIMVTPEYNHGYPAVLKNALDYAFTEWHNKPVAFITYGGTSGGLRAVEQLRQVVIELQMAPISEAVSFQYARHAFDEQGQPKDPAAADRLQSMFHQLNWWAQALSEARAKTRPKGGG